MSSFDSDSEITRLDGAIRARLAQCAGIGNFDAFQRDVQQQIGAVDALTTGTEVSGGRDIRQHNVRRAAVDMLDRVLDPELRITGYSDMLGRRADLVLDRDRFIAGFESSEYGVIAIKAYGADVEPEVRALRILADYGGENALPVLSSGFDEGTWFVMPVFDGPTLTGTLFLNRLNRLPGHIDADGRTTARRHDQPTNPIDSLGATARVAALMSNIHRASQSDVGGELIDVREFWRKKVSSAQQKLANTQYGDLVAFDMREFAMATATRHSKRVFAHGDLYPANVFTSGNKVALVDPSGVFAMPELDGAMWIDRVAPHDNMRHHVRTWVQRERDLNPAALAACIAIDAYVFASDLETIKIQQGATRAMAPADDLQTIALIETSNAFVAAVLDGQIQTFGDVLEVLDKVSVHVHLAHEDREAPVADVALQPGQQPFVLERAMTQSTAVI